MQQSKQWLKGAQTLCCEIGPEDGIDPKLRYRSDGATKQGPKGRQLCKAAQRTLSLLLGGEFNDPILHGVAVVDVVSNDKGASLWVSLSYKDAGFAVSADQVLQKLQRIQGSLRAEIARSVKRKRVPTLRFKLVRAGNEDSCNANS